MDLFSRKPVGWAMSNSDKDGHYTSKQFRQLLWRNQIKQSMSRRVNCWDNCPMERFSNNKSERMPKIDYKSLGYAKSAVMDYIINYYCLVRPQKHNLDSTPNESERIYWADYKAVTKKNLTTTLSPRVTEKRFLKTQALGIIESLHSRE